MSQIRIGVSGWNYPGWRKTFYPEGLPQTRELEYATDVFDSIEVNGTFYGLTTPAACRRWYEAAPDDFIYAVKGSRFITHNKKLHDVEVPLANFLAAGVLELSDKLGPVLWQLSPRIGFRPDRVEHFFELLPPDTQAAADIARAHDDRVTKTSFGPGTKLPMRHVLEIRHDSYFTDEVVDLARRHGVALAFSHSSRWPYVEEITADFVYVRLHGPDRLYDSPYGDSLTVWADRIRAWRRGDEPDDAVRLTDREPPAAEARDVYVYFDNDGHAYAPHEARRLRALMSD